MLSSAEVGDTIRQSLGMPAKPEPAPAVLQEGHVCEFPYWSFSKKRSSITQLDIAYKDNTFMTLLAPLGMPSPSFAGYLDAILYYGQRDLFIREYVEISVYKILQTLEIDPENGGAYAHFHRDMERAFMAAIKTDRFRNPQTGQRDRVSYFRILRRMELAKRRQGISQFYFDDLFLASLRSGYLKRLDWDYCLHLDKQGEALARFLYGHLIKRIGEKSIYQRSVIGFLTDIGLGYLAKKEPMRRNELVKRTVFPALKLLTGAVLRGYEQDDRGNLFFIPL
jgi:hypothetical protein